MGLSGMELNWTEYYMGNSIDFGNIAAKNGFELSTYM
jgi:hypothetical protein